jgi:hypothetical protein
MLLILVMAGQRQRDPAIHLAALCGIEFFIAWMDRICGP